MRKLICFLLTAFNCLFIDLASAQQWFNYAPTVGFDINAVDILKPGYIVIGGGSNGVTPFQIMFSSPDYGVTWHENMLDAVTSWNKSVAFADTIHGFGVGAQGRVINTGDGGYSWPNVNQVTGRDFNKIVNVSPLIYYAVGGESDSVQTIVNTMDGGIHWNVLYDTAGPWLNSVCFINPLKGFAVGDSGVILSTTNGGNSWIGVTTPIVRNFEAIAFINADTGFIAGGSQSAGRRTILQTVNGGANWTILLDATGGILNDISFATASEGYIAGDSGTLLKTTNSGQTWTRQFISNALTGTETFRSVKFYDRNFGAIGGKGGVFYLYTGWPLDVFTLGPVLQDSADATLFAGINTHGHPEAVNFVYSTDSTFVTSSSTPVLSFVSDTFLPLSVRLSYLTPNTWYYYFVSSGTKTGDTLRFFTGTMLPPVFATVSGAVIDSTTIRLKGEVHGINPVSNLVFEYGVTPRLGSVIAATPATISDVADHAITALLGSVQPYTNYYYRLRGQSGADTLRGDIYITGSLYHILQTLPATYVGDTIATLNGQEQGFPGAVTLSFEYWASHGPGAITNQTFNFSTSDTLRIILDIAHGLHPRHIYYYHIKAVSSSGTNYGNLVLFFTGSMDSVIQTLPARQVTTSSAMLEGMVNYFGDSATLSFEYGTDSTLGNTIASSPGTVSDSLYHSISALLSGVPANTMYFYRLKAVLSNGSVIFGNIRQVFIGGNEIPNWDFQNWTVNTSPVPQGWTLATQTFSRVAGHSGNYAVNITGLNVLILGWPSDEPGLLFRGGEAITSRPDSLSFYVNSSFAQGDTGSVLVYMHLGDSLVAFDVAELPTNTSGLFQRVSIPINYQSALTPDTVVIGFLTGNITNSGSNAQVTASPNSSLTIDDVAFMPSTPPVYNGDFETWYDQSFDILDRWSYSAYIKLDSSVAYNPIVSKTYYTPPGDFAAEVKNVYLNGIGWVRGAFVDDVNSFASDQKPSFPVISKHVTLNGYYKAFPVTLDTMQISVSMFYRGQEIGAGRLLVTDSVPEFTPFTIPINYMNNSVEPDSANIQVSTATILGVYGASNMTIDKLHFDGFASGINENPVIFFTFDANGVKVYPNPSRNLMTLELEEVTGEGSVIDIYNINGQKEKELKMAAGEQKTSFSVDDVMAGVYLLKWQNGNKVVNKKIVVLR